MGFTWNPTGVVLWERMAVPLEACGSVPERPPSPVKSLLLLKLVTPRELSLHTSPEGL